MLYRKIGKLDKDISAIGLGTWAIGGGEWWGDSDEELSIQTIQQAMTSGINLIDTAPAYGFGKSEEIVGRAIKGNRDKVVLSTKCGLWWQDDRGTRSFEMGNHKVNYCLEPDTIKYEIEASLKRLQTDYIDIYFTHWPSIPPHETPIEQTMKCLMQLKEEGLIKAIGASNVEKKHIDAYIRYGELDIVQEKYSMLDRKIEETHKPSCIENNLTIMAYSPLEQGLLTGKIGMDKVFGEKEYRNAIPWFKLENRRKVLDMLEKWEPLTDKYNCTLAHLVIAWTLNQDKISHVLCGARKPEQIKETAKAANLGVSREDLEMMTKDIIK